MSVVLYSTNCPKCKVLEKKLDSIGVDYTIVTDEDLMISKGFSSAPMLEVDGNIMDFGNAVRWAKEQK
jgi:glutaredoxin